MSYAQFPYDTLISLGQNMQTLSDKLQGHQRGAEDCDGLSGDHAGIQDAISDFRGEWKTSLLDLMTNIDKWGGLSQAIGKMVADFDAQTATALRPPE